MFYVCTVAIGIIYLAVLELSKNTAAGWVIGILAIAAMILYRVRFFNMEKRGRYTAAAFAVYFLVLIVNLILTGPPAKRVPAVDNKHPDVTDVISISQGQLTGVYNEDHSARVYAGIPYAKAPTGDLRFREPEKPEGWEGVKACDHYGPMAMQQRDPVIYQSLSHILGWHDYSLKPGDEYVEEVSEDCLYLNVFTPAQTGDVLLPVIFYVHGGSLTTGQSSYSEYRGEDLAKKGVIFVSFAYRLGVFGYYAADDLRAESANATTGNYGLLDQIAALQWVYDNIEAFGGDRDRITIAGESAGASSVNALCVSPLTKGLFRYAIAESSGIVAKEPFHTFRYYDEAIETGNEVRKEFNVSSSAELRDIPASRLLKTATANSAMTVDGYAITEQPYLTYEKGENHEQALLNGFNAKEADAFLLGTEATRDNYTELLAENLYDHAEAMAEVVPPDLPKRDQHFVIDALGDAKGSLNVAYSAMWFSYSHYVWNEYMVRQGRPAYEYYFTKTNNILSNYHAGEIPYAYGNLWRHPGLYDEDDYRLSAIMQSYWVNFVKTGDPNGYIYNDDGTVGDELLPVWESRGSGQDKLLELGTDIRMRDDPNTGIYAVLDDYMDSRVKNGTKNLPEPAS